jgi:hypothetical protein
VAWDGAIVFNLLIAGVLTLIVGVVALLLLRRAMLRQMAVTAGRPPPGEDPEGPPRSPAASPLRIEIETPQTGLADPSRPILGRMAAAHAAAGLAFAAAATVLILAMSGTAFLPLRTSIVVWAFAWPTVLALNFLTGPDRRLQLFVVAAYFGVLFLLCGLVQLAGTESLELGGVRLPAFFHPLVLWAIYAFPSLFLLLFLNRTIRTIGPTVILAVVVMLIGGQIALAAVHSEPILARVVEFTAAVGIGGHGLFWLTAALGMSIAAWPAWRAAAVLRDQYAAKRTSDLLIATSAIWLLQALVLSFSLGREQGFVGALAAAIPFLAWRGTLAAGLRPVRREAQTRPELRLLLLRVFGFGRRTRRLVDLLGARWRLMGSIDLIAAPDLASRTVEPSSFMAFLRGRLGTLFIQTSEQLEDRFASLDHRPDPDGRYRVNPLFCGNDMWKQAVVRLMRGASLVVMDLRGFTADRQGCIYELQTLLDVVPLGRLLFLIDATTEVEALERIVQERWRHLDAASPNRSLDEARLRLLAHARSDVTPMLELLAASWPAKEDEELESNT